VPILSAHRELPRPTARAGPLAPRWPYSALLSDETQFRGLPPNILLRVKPAQEARHLLDRPTARQRLTHVLDVCLVYLDEHHIMAEGHDVVTSEIISVGALTIPPSGLET
jgi:hypothetical protein